MWYYTKKAILESMWKDWKDVRLLDRMIARGQVIEENWKYKLFTEEDNVMVSDRIAELEKEIKKLRDENEWLVVENSELMQELEKRPDLYELVDKVYRYLTQTLHLRLDKNDFIERVENN